MLGRVVELNTTHSRSFITRATEVRDLVKKGSYSFMCHLFEGLIKSNMEQIPSSSVLKLRCSHECK